MIWSRNDMGNKYQFSRFRAGETFRTMVLFSLLIDWQMETSYNIQESDALRLAALSCCQMEKTLPSKLSASFPPFASAALQPHTSLTSTARACCGIQHCTVPRLGEEFNATLPEIDPRRTSKK